ncbi:MAG: hypothetical protein AB1633_06065, partial [Elusimicrobiota bacterium]
MKKIRVKTGNNRSYDILIGFNILDKIGKHIRSAVAGDSSFIITSSRIGKLYLDSIVKSLKKSGIEDFGVNYIP